MVDGPVLPWAHQRRRRRGQWSQCRSIMGSGARQAAGDRRSLAWRAHPHQSLRRADMTEVVQCQHQSEARSGPGGASQRDSAVDDPVVRMDNLRPLLPGDAGQLADTQRIRHRWVVGAAGRIDTRQKHRSHGEPVHPDPRCEGFLIRDASHALGRYRHLVPPLGEGVREVENVTLLATDVRREKLGQQKDAHQNNPAAAAEDTTGRQSNKLLRHHLSRPGYDGVQAVLALTCRPWKLSQQTVTGGEMHAWLVTPHCACGRSRVDIGWLAHDEGGGQEPPSLDSA